MSAVCSSATIGAVLHDPHARARLLGAKEIVRGHEHRRATLAEPADELGEFVGRLGVEARGGLVEQQHVGPFGRGDGNTDLLPHSLGVASDALIDLIRPQAGVDEIAHQLVAVERAVGGQAREVLEVLEAGEIPVQHHRFGDVRDVALAADRIARDVDAAHTGFAARGGHEVEKEADGGRLAGAIRAQQAEHFARMDVERERVERGDVAIALGEGAGREERRRCALGRRRGGGHGGSVGSRSGGARCG